MNLVKIIIADDHSLFINGLQLLLAEEDWINVVDVANNGRELLTVLQKTTADLVLLDINMPQLNGLEATRLIKQSFPAIKLVVLSTYSEDHIVEKAKSFGVNGYLLKNCSKEELLQTIMLVMSGHTSFPYRAPKEISLLDKEDNFLRQFNLTKREIELLQLVKDGLTNQQMAEKLFLSIYTIETHRKNILQKLGLKNSVGLMKFIMQHHL